MVGAEQEAMPRLNERGTPSIPNFRSGQFSFIQRDFTVKMRFTPNDQVAVFHPSQRGIHIFVFPYDNFSCSFLCYPMEDADISYMINTMCPCTSTPYREENKSA